MYALFKLSQQSRSFVTDTLSSVTNAEPLFCVAVGYSVALDLPLPPQQTDDLRAYYALNVQRTVQELVSAFNELAPFDTVAAREAVFSFYKLRYNALYGRIVPLAMNKESAIVDFFGISLALPNWVIELVQKDSKRLSIIIGRMRDLIREMYQQQTDLRIKQDAAEPRTNHHVAD